MALNSTSSATCHICCELYTDPRMLECLHSFCSKCLEKTFKEQGSGTSLKCPKCEKTASIPEGGINTLPKDLRKSYKAECVLYASKIESKEEISCEQCVDTSSGPAVSFCVECCEFICKACARHHKFARKTLSHELVTVGEGKIDDKKRKQQFAEIPQKTIICHLHEGETFKYFCVTCSTLICHDCMTMEHSGHSYDCIEKIAKKHKQELIFARNSADSANVCLDDAIAKGNEALQQVQHKQKSVEKDVQSTFKLLYDALSQRKKCLLAKAAEIGLSKQTALAIQGEEFSSLHKEIAETCGMITAVIESYTTAEMLSAKALMINKLQQLMTQYKKIHLEPCKGEEMYSDLDTTELVKKIGSFGCVFRGSHPRKAETDLNFFTATVGKIKKINITTHNVAGQRFLNGGEKVEIALNLMGSDDPAITAEVLDKQDGTYIASFTPQIVGEHKLSITIDSQHIKGSPFPLYVRQARNYGRLFNQVKFSLSGQPYDVAVNDNGDVYVALYNYHCIEVYNKSGTRIRTIGTPRSYGSGEGQFQSPSAIAIHGNMLYVADSSNNRVQKLTLSGKFISQFGKDHLNNPRGICLDKDGMVFVSSCGNNQVCVFEADGTHIRDIIGSASDGSNHNGPWGLAFDCSGNLHVAEYNTNTIKVFTPQGQYVTSYNSRVTNPAGIAIDDEGHTFVGEHYYNSQVGYSCLCVLNSWHLVINSPRLLQQATGVTVDKEGFIYLCGYNHNYVYKY